jgi:hypothetical protein
MFHQIGNKVHIQKNAARYPMTIFNKQKQTRAKMHNGRTTASAARFNTKNLRIRGERGKFNS